MVKLNALDAVPAREAGRAVVEFKRGDGMQDAPVCRDGWTECGGSGFGPDWERAERGWEAEPTAVGRRGGFRVGAFLSIAAGRRGGLRIPEQQQDGTKRTMVAEIRSWKACVDPVVLEVGDPLPWWKRVLDVLFLAGMLPVFLPLGLGIALYIKWRSRGPAIFRQERVGYGGRRFTCLKFRTMRVDAEVGTHREHLRVLMEQDAPLTKLDTQGDSRLIPGGALLRASGLDELPQLINVLRGEMSVVGPRPCLPYEYAEYSDWEKQRLAVLPGLTGLWQVSGKNRTTFRQMIALDIEYARRKTLGLDVRIMWRTMATLVGQVRERRAAKATAAETMPGLLATPQPSREAA